MTRKQITVVVMGEDVVLPCTPATTIAELRHDALVWSRNTSRPEEDFEPRDENGRMLYLGTTVDQLSAWPLVYLSLAVGSGGAA
jgi:hypothetical protein